MLMSEHSETTNCECEVVINLLISLWRSLENLQGAKRRDSRLQARGRMSKQGTWTYCLGQKKSSQN